MNIIVEAENVINTAMGYLSGFQTAIDSNQHLVSFGSLAFAIIGAVAFIRKVITRFRRVQVDPRRFFTGSDRAAGFARAGGRCEMDGFLLMRCRSRAEHGDHHYPHSRGGATTLDNFVAACAHHNMKKSDKVPSQMATRRLQNRRLRYFPEGTPVAVGSRVGREARTA